MPVFTDETEDGRTVYVTLDRVPVGRKALNEAMAQKVSAGEFSFDPPEQTPGQKIRSGASDVYSTLIAPVTRGASMLLQGGGTGLELESLPGRALRGEGIPTEPPPLTTPSSDALAGLVVPQTPTQAGMMLGTAGAGGLAARVGMAGMKATGARVLGSAAGGEVGNQIEGGPLGVGAIEGAAGVGVGEALGAGYSFLRKSLPGGMTAIAQKALDDFRASVATWLPGITGPKNAAGMKELIRSGKLLNAAGDRYMESMRRASDAMGNNALNVPALADKPMPKARILSMLKESGYGDAPIPPDMAVNLPSDMRAAFGDATTRMTANEAAEFLAQAGYGRKTLTLSEAVERLKAFGYSGYSGEKELRANRTLAGRPSRAQWEEALQQIRSEIQRFNPTGEARAIFDAGRHEYAVASTVHGMLKKEGVYIGVPNDVRFNPNAVRMAWESGKFQKVKDAIPADEYAVIESTLYGDAPFGSRDLLRGGPDTMTAAGAQLMRSGGGASTGALFPARSLVPGAGNQYTGQRPFALGAGQQTGLDLAVQGASFPLMQDLNMQR